MGTVHHARGGTEYSSTDTIVAHGINGDGGVRALEACISSSDPSGGHSYAPVVDLVIQGFAEADEDSDVEDSDEVSDEEEAEDIFTPMTKFMSRLPALECLTIRHASKGAHDVDIDPMLHALLWDDEDDNDKSAPPVVPVQAQVSEAVEPPPRSICPTLIYLSADTLKDGIESRTGDTSRRQILHTTKL